MPSPKTVSRPSGRHDASEQIKFSVMRTAKRLGTVRGSQAERCLVSQSGFRERVRRPERARAQHLATARRADDSSESTSGSPSQRGLQPKTGQQARSRLRLHHQLDALAGEVASGSPPLPSHHTRTFVGKPSSMDAVRVVEQ